MSDSYLDQRSVRRFQRNLRRVKDWTDPAIATGLQLAANEVVKHAKAGHPRPSSPAERIDHPHPRYYDWTGNLTGSIRAGKVKAYKDGAEILVHAGSPTIRYAARVEFGSSRSRAFPYMRPALRKNANVMLQILGEAIKRVI